MKKKSPSTCLAEYRISITDTKELLAEVVRKQLSSSVTRQSFDYSVLVAYRAFERFLLDVAIARINRDPSTFYEAVGVNFGEHITAAQCEFLLVGDRYFDFRGHSGLIDVLKKVSGSDSTMVQRAKAPAARQAF